MREKLPRKEEIEDVLEIEEALNSRKWKSVKDYVHNLIRRSKKLAVVDLFKL
jgi:hypothetical protein